MHFKLLNRQDFINQIIFAKWFPPKNFEYTVLKDFEMSLKKLVKEFNM